MHRKFGENIAVINNGYHLNILLKNPNRTDRVRIALAIVGFEMHLNYKHIKGIH